MNKEFTLCAGIWEYWFFDKETNKPLTQKMFIGELQSNQTKITIEVPEYLKNNDNAIIRIQRTR